MIAPYTEDMLTVLMSCTKGAVAICAGMLAERGLLDVEAPVAKYWPEFAANGKAHLTVAHCLSHTAGLPTFPIASGITARDFVDWDKCTRALADATPLWAPGAHASYHAVTYGFLVGEVIRRVTGKSFGTFFELRSPNRWGWSSGLAFARRPAEARRTHSSTGRRLSLADGGAGVNVNDRSIEILAGFDAIAEAVDFFNTPVGRAANYPPATALQTHARSPKCMPPASARSTATAAEQRHAGAAMQPRQGSALAAAFAHLPTPQEGFGLGSRSASGERRCSARIVRP
jgi:CubicO group peptidase (beta-lactamase class C family)